jgi:hypothetical protein
MAERVSVKVRSAAVEDNCCVGRSIKFVVGMVVHRIGVKLMDMKKTSQF